MRVLINNQILLQNNGINVQLFKLKEEFVNKFKSKFKTERIETTKLYNEKWNKALKEIKEEEQIIGNNEAELFASWLIKNHGFKKIKYTSIRIIL